VLAALLDLILPPHCAGCGRPAFPACPACAARLHGSPSPRPPENPPPGLPEVWAGAEYAGCVRRLLIAHKEHGRQALAPLLGGCLAETLAAASGGSWGPMELVPVPSAPAATRNRGHDPVRRMAAAAVRDLRARGWPVTLAPVLRQRRRVADQAGLSAAERAANLAGGFEAQERWARASGRVLAVLVDDVVTTGATLAAAAEALRAAGARAPFAVTVAATRKRVSATRHARDDRNLVCDRG
jgi:predicted amidophosphoribosyltransferase